MEKIDENNINGENGEQSDSVLQQKSTDPEKLGAIDDQPNISAKRQSHNSKGSKIPNKKGKENKLVDDKKLDAVRNRPIPTKKRKSNDSPGVKTQNTKGEKNKPNDDEISDKIDTGPGTDPILPKKRKSNDGESSNASNNNRNETKKMKPVIMKDERVDILVKKIDETISRISTVSAGAHDPSEDQVDDQIDGHLTRATHNLSTENSDVDSPTNSANLSLKHVIKSPHKDDSSGIPSTSNAATQLGVNEEAIETTKKCVIDNEKMNENTRKNGSSERKSDKKASKKNTKKKKHHSYSSKEVMDRIGSVERRLQTLEENNAKRHAEVMQAFNEILDNWNEHKRIPSNMNSKILEQKTGYPEPGFARISDSMVHIGQGIYIPKANYDTAFLKSRTNGMFVKKMLMTQFTEEELQTHSATGASSNRVMVGVKKPALDPTKLRAIQDIFEHYLKSQHLDQETFTKELHKFNEHVRSKISDARAEKRRREKPKEPKKIPMRNHIKKSLRNEKGGEEEDAEEEESGEESEEEVEKKKKGYNEETESVEDVETDSTSESDEDGDSEKND